MQREIAAPASYDEWLSAWRVFAMAMRALGAASNAKLTAYENHIHTLAKRYKSEWWWLVAQADARMRREQWPRIKQDGQTQKTIASKKGEPHDFDPERPWDWVLKKAVQDKDYWNTELSEKVNLFTNHLATKAELADEGYGPKSFIQNTTGAGSSDGGNPSKRQRTGGKWGQGQHPGQRCR